MKRILSLGSCLAAAGVLVLTLAALPARSGPFDRIKQRVQQKVGEKTDKAVDKSVDKAGDAVTGKGKQAGAEGAKAAPEKAETGSADAEGAAAGAASSPTPGQPDLAAVKADLIPGERVVFYDDFKDMMGDEPPPHWKVRGGKAELKTGEAVRQLTLTGRGLTITPNLAGSLPKNFTLESEIFFKGHGADLRWTFPTKGGDEEGLSIRTAVVYEKLMLHMEVGREQLVSDYFEMDWNRPLKTALWVQDGRLRFYVNGARLVDVNQLELPELLAPTFHVDASPSDDTPDRQVGFRRWRIAESAPDFGQVILSKGRYVTHGIHFDTDSDRLQPESAPMIKSVARVLLANPDLALTIEGHTDSVGVAAHNLDLSKRRAEAVKAVLVTQFNVDEGRLACAGLGSTRAMASNRTADGRALNRRVEFARK